MGMSGASVDVHALLRELADADAAIASLQRTTEAQQRCVRHLQGPLHLLRQQRNGAPPEDASGEVFHAQLHVSPASTAQSTASVASAQVAWHAAGGAAGVSGAAQRSPPLLLLHVHMVNQSNSSVETSAEWTSLRLQLQVRPFVGWAGAERAISFHSLFPAPRWHPRHVWRATVPIDASLLQHAHITFSLHLRMRKYESGTGFVEVLIHQWTLDAFDTCTPIMPTSTGTTSTLSLEPAAKRQRMERKDNGGAGKLQPPPLHEAHSVASMIGVDDNSALHSVPLLPLVASIYSTPSWYVSAMCLPSTLSVSLGLDAAQISVAFVVPPLLDNQCTRANSTVIYALMRMLVSSLFPAHHLAFTEAAITSLLPPDTFVQQHAPAHASSVSGTKRELSYGTSSVTLRFTTRILGQLIEWTIEAKLPSTPPSPVLFELCVHCPLPEMLPLLRAQIMHRLHRALFRPLVPGNQLSSSASAAQSERSEDAALLSVAAGEVSLRKAAPLLAICGGSDTMLAAAKEAQKWRLEYLRAPGNSTICGNAGVVALTRPAQTTRSSGASSNDAAHPTPLQQHVVKLHAALADAQQQIAQLVEHVQTVESLLSSSDQRQADIVQLATNVMQVYLGMRSAASSNSSRNSLTSTQLGSVHTSVF